MNFNNNTLYSFIRQGSSFLLTKYYYAILQQGKRRN